MKRRRIIILFLTIAEGIFLGVYSKEKLGLMVIVRAASAGDALDRILTANPDKKRYQTQFRHPNGNFIEYDLDAPKDTWVIKRVNNKSVNREFDRWPFFEGNIEPIK